MTRLLPLLILGATPAEAAGPAPMPEVAHGLQAAERGDGLHLGGDLHIDTGYERSGRQLESEPDIVFWLQQGRFMLRATPTRNAGDGWFFKAQAQILAHVDEIDGDQHIDTDDAWGKFGKWDSWDLQLGRYEAWEVYHKGQGLERDTLEDLGAWDGPDIYEVNYAFYRQNGHGQAALHLYPADWLRFELGTVFGNDVGFNSLGVRPVGILDLGAIKVKFAGEWRQTKNQEEGKKHDDERRGFGGSVQGFFDEPGSTLPIQFGLNGAFGRVDTIDGFGKVNVKGSTDTLSLGGFLNAALPLALSLGLGINFTAQDDRNENPETERVGEFTHRQAFVSLKRSVIVPEATAKLVLAHAKADLRPSHGNNRVNEMISARFRLMHVF